MYLSRSNHAKAISLESGRFSTTQQIRAGDRSDTFQLRLSNRSGVYLQLQSLEAAVEATIAFDRNRNGRLDRSESIAQTGATRSSKALTRSNLRSGTYWIQVSPAAPGSVRYRLTLTPTAAPSTLAVARSSNSFINRVLQLTNAFRRQSNLNPLRLNPQLTAAAQQYVQAMATQDFFAHQGRDGSSAQSRGSAAGYAGSIGENLAAGHTTPKQVVQGWINSPSHRANLLDSRYRDIGIGYFDNPNDSGKINYRYYWAQSFGIPTR